MSLFKEPCGGCGETRSDRRCLNCLHEAIDWTKKSKPAKTIELDKAIQICQAIADECIDDAEYRGALACVRKLEKLYESN